MTLASTDPFIGRAQELERLLGLVEGITSGSAATVLIEGEAGIGKTRLLASLIAGARERGVAVFHGEAHPLERIRPFGVLVDALDLRSGSSDPRRGALGRLLAGEDVGAAGELAAGQLQFRVVEEIIDLIEVASDHGPVLLALDDLHWADSSTLLAFRWMTRQLIQVPLLLVATLRPSPRTVDLAQLLDDALAAGAEAIRVEPLDSPDVGALVQAELGLPPGPTLAEAVGRAAGNPREVAEGAEEAAALAGEVPSDQSAARRCRGLIERDPEAMLEAVELARRGRRVLDHAGTCEDAATVFGSRGRPVDAQVLLAEALDLYEAIGADWYVARANASLRRFGARRGTRGSRERALTGWDSLNQERAFGRRARR